MISIPCWICPISGAFMSTCRFPGARILLITKAPVPGQVKTRLAPLLGAQGAADFLQAEILRTSAWLYSSRLAPVEIWAGLDVAHPLFAGLREQYGWSVHAQVHGDLGSRMLHAARQSLATASHVVLLGTDCPQLDAEYLADALSRLQSGAEVVIGPATDGGYVLLGLNQAHPALFDGIEWSTPQVLEQTRDRLRALGLAWQELPALADVDTPEDYRRLYGAD